MSDTREHPLTATVQMARRIFLAWEKLRLLYVLALAAVGGFIFVRYPSLDIWKNIALWALILQGAVLANLLYFAGPLVETYLSWLGVQHYSIRASLFLSGTLLATLLTYVVLNQTVADQLFLLSFD